MVMWILEAAVVLYGVRRSKKEKGPRNMTGNKGSWNLILNWEPYYIEYCYLTFNFPFFLVFSLFFSWGIVVLQCCVSFYCTVKWNRVPCAIQQVLISYLFYKYKCIYVSPNLPIQPITPFPPWSPYVCSLHLCLYFCLANWFICTIFLDSTNMH